MAADLSSTVRLLQCLAGLPLNASSFEELEGSFANANASSTLGHTDNYGADQRRRHGLQNASDADDWRQDDGRETTWIRDFIKTKLVPTICVVGIVGNLLTLATLNK